ncbi:hypothetical protein [Oscillibacter sp.]|uniref:hypothetical protein n=1 Tax=Oscillibacter sp. TaxID=1945593 RepID=UPI00289F72FE|nr:hypothetical protein [Oscillibacter sp.]
MDRTEQYQLSRWQKSDRILMDDFNADNAKIDAALAVNAAAIAAEKATREAGAAAEESARKSADANEEATRRNADAAEEAARKSADAALQSSIITTNPIARLADVTLAYDANQVNLSLAGIDWAAYAEVVFYARLRAVAYSTRVELTLDEDRGATSYYFSTSTGYNIQSTLGGLYVDSGGSSFGARIPYTRLGFLLHWFGAPDSNTSGSPLSYISYCNGTQKQRIQYSNLNFNASQPLAAGSRIVMLGVKL